jgi:hypothetical protein
MMQTYATPTRARRPWIQGVFAVLCFLFLATSAWSQSESLVVSGSLKHEDTKERLDNVMVSVLQDGSAFDEIQVDRNGKYFLDLPLRHNYVIVFSSDGMISKRVAINSAQTPEGQLSDGFMFDLDMSLFDTIEGFDEGIMETPIGIASFDDRSGRIQFDLDHTNDMRRRIDDELDRLAELADDMERAQMRYDNAMEDADRAEARQRWDDAKDEFEKALDFKPGDAAAQAGLDRVSAQLDVLRQAEEAAAAVEAAAAAADEAARQAEENAAREAAEAASRSEREAQEARDAELAAEQAEEQARADQEARDRAAEEDASRAQEAADQAARDRTEQEAADRAAQVQAGDDAAAARQAQREAEAAERQAQLEANSAEQQALLDAEKGEREARQREWDARQDAREAEKRDRQAQAQARAQSLSQRSSKAEDEAEAYYRQALESERQAMAAEVQDVKYEVSIQAERWNAEANDRARDARRSVLSLDNGTRGTTGREVGQAYEGREEEHRLKRAAQLAEIEALKQADEALKAQSSARLKNESQGALLDLDMTVEASKERGVPVGLSPEDRDIPQGVQETSYDIQNGLVIMRTVRQGDVVKRYRKVVMKTGTYYFCGDQSITKTRWELETNFSYD